MRLLYALHTASSELTCVFFCVLGVFTSCSDEHMSTSMTANIQKMWHVTVCVDADMSAHELNAQGTCLCIKM